MNQRAQNPAQPCTDPTRCAAIQKLEQYANVPYKPTSQLNKKTQKDAFALMESKFAVLNRLPNRDGNAVRIMTYNVWVFKRGYDAVQKTIIDQNPDIVVLQEVLPKDIEKLTLLKSKYPNVATGFTKRFHAKTILRSIGNVIFSRFPIANQASYNLKEGLFDRVAVEATINWQFKSPSSGQSYLFPIHVIGTHLSFGENQKREQIRAQQSSTIANLCNKYFASYKNRRGFGCIIAGDLNSETQHFSDFRQVFAETNQKAPVTQWRGTAIDNIYFKGPMVTLNAQQIHTDASDHLPVVADLAMGNYLTRRQKEMLQSRQGVKFQSSVAAPSQNLHPGIQKTAPTAR